MERIPIPTVRVAPTAVGVLLALAIGCRSTFAVETDGLTLEPKVTSANPHVLGFPVELSIKVKNVLKTPVTVAMPRFLDTRTWHGHSPLVVSVRQADEAEWRVVNASNPDFPIHSDRIERRWPSAVMERVSLDAGDEVTARVSLIYDWGRGDEMSPIFKRPGKYWVKVSYQPFKVRLDVPDEGRAGATIVSRAVQVEIRALRDGNEVRGWVADEIVLPEARLKDKMRPYIIAGQWAEAVAVVEGDREYQANKAKFVELNKLLEELREKIR